MGNNKIKYVKSMALLVSLQTVRWDERQNNMKCTDVPSKLHIHLCISEIKYVFTEHRKYHVH